MKQIYSVSELPGGWRQVRLQAPALAGTARPGQHLLLGRQRWPVLRAAAPWVDCLGTHAPPPAECHVQGPLGEAFDLAAATPRALLLGDVPGLAPLVFLADRLRGHQPRVKPLLFLAVDRPAPFTPQPSGIMVPGLPGGVIAALPLLEDWGLPSRLASRQDLPGCFAGTVAELSRNWLETLQGSADVTLFACGSEELLNQARDVASDFQLPCQVLEAPG